MWVFVVVIVLSILYMTTRKPRGFPPGPPRYPLVGFAPFLEKHLPHKHMWRLSDKYGPVVGCYFGTQPTVIVNEWQAVKETLQNDDLNGRPINSGTDILYKAQKGVMFTEGEYWKDQRRFILHQFRNFGFAKRSHEEFVQEEVKAVLKEMGEAEGSIDPIGILGVSNINILWAIMGGKRFERSDCRLWDLVDGVNKVFRTGEISGGLLQSYPFLRHVVSKEHPFNVVLTGFSEVNDFIMVAIKEHRATLDADNPRDFIDVFLIEMDKQNNNSDTTFTETQLVATCTDLFTAGTETGSATVSFGILLMALHPEIMEKVQKEIDEVVGHARLPSTEDRSKMVFTDATMNEVFRFRSAAPITVPHKAMRDTTLQGHRIPEGTMVLVNLYSVLMEPGHWGDPFTFRPERFLNPDGSLRKDDHFIPFGKGRRICLGESLARMSSFIMFTSLMQHFTFSLDPAVPVPNTEGKSGFTLGPPYFKVFAKPRLV